MCLVDEDDEIRQRTGTFFEELARKSATILYNALPDIISRLSDPKWKLEEGKYQTIMRFIFGLISIDRHEGLVGKLCDRVKIAQQERQWLDIAFCLSLLNYNEKTMRKLADNIATFKDKLQVQEIYDYFRAIIADTSKLAKRNLKVRVIGL